MSKDTDYTALHSDDIIADTEAEKQALLMVNAYMDRWNARDVEGVGSTLHFPHIRIASGKVNRMEKGSQPANFFDIFAEKTGWAYSLWGCRTVAPLVFIPQCG